MAKSIQDIILGDKSEFSVKRNLFEKRSLIREGVLVLSIKSANSRGKINLLMPKLPFLEDISAPCS